MTTSSHNHFTRDIKKYGECPACDVYWDRWNDNYVEEEVNEP